jgi:hypothetical protein
MHCCEERVAAIVREIYGRYSSDVSGCADAKLICEEILRNIKKDK